MQFLYPAAQPTSSLCSCPLLRPAFLAIQPLHCCSGPVTEAAEQHACLVLQWYVAI